MTVHFSVTRTIAIDTIAEQLNNKGHSASISDDAGGYLCNAVLYHSLAFAEAHGGCNVGFVHIPSDLSEPRRMNEVGGGAFEIIKICAGSVFQGDVLNPDLTSRALARSRGNSEPHMTFDRRSILGAGLGLGAAATAVRATDKSATAANAVDISSGLTPDDGRDQTSALQAAIDAASEKDIPLVLPAGIFVVSDLRLRPGTRLLGAARTTIIAFGGGNAFVTADKADGLVLSGIVFDCAYKKFDTGHGEGAVTALSLEGSPARRPRYPQQHRHRPLACRMQRPGQWRHDQRRPRCWIEEPRCFGPRHHRQYDLGLRQQRAF